MPTDRPDQPPVHPAARANDLFRRSIGKDARVGGALTFDAALSTLTLRQRRAVVEAVRGYAFSPDDGEQEAVRETATVTVLGVAYRFRIVREPGDADGEPGSRLLIISLA